MGTFAESIKAKKLQAFLDKQAAEREAFEAQITDLSEDLAAAVKVLETEVEDLEFKLEEKKEELEAARSELAEDLPEEEEDEEEETEEAATPPAPVA